MLQGIAAVATDAIPCMADPESQNTWEPRDNLNCDDKLKQFFETVGHQKMTWKEKLEASKRAEEGKDMQSHQDTRGPSPAASSESSAPSQVASSVVLPAPATSYAPKDVWSSYVLCAFSARKNQTFEPLLDQWCICRRPYYGETVIECVGCGEFYHPSCIGMLDSCKEVEAKVFVCKECKSRGVDVDPSLLLPAQPPSTTVRSIEAAPGVSSSSAARGVAAALGPVSSSSSKSSHLRCDAFESPPRSKVNSSRVFVISPSKVTRSASFLKERDVASSSNSRSARRV